jgi:uroporphyrinogen decarboxylase
MFHSDGNINPLLGGLVDAGIDGLNPLEVVANMDAPAIHRAHPHLFMAGGIDTSQLLPMGSPDDVRAAVRRALDGSGGRLMVGSSSELHEGVPLKNFLAMRDAVLSYK